MHLLLCQHPVLRVFICYAQFHRARLIHCKPHYQGSLPLLALPGSDNKLHVLTAEFKTLNGNEEQDVNILASSGFWDGDSNDKQSCVLGNGYTTFITSIYDSHGHPGNVNNIWLHVYDADNVPADHPY